MNQIIMNELKSLTNAGTRFGMIRSSGVFVELNDVSYDEDDGQLYYYHPIDERVYPIDNFIYQLHGKYIAWTDCLYFINNNEIVNNDYTRVLFKDYIHTKYNVRISVMEEGLAGKPKIDDLPE